MVKLNISFAILSMELDNEILFSPHEFAIAVSNSNLG
jgi:hypothetical protein